MCWCRRSPQASVLHRAAAEKAVDGSSAPMRPISGFSSCAARSRMDDALAALLVAYLGGPRGEDAGAVPGSPNLSPPPSAGLPADQAAECLERGPKALSVRTLNR